MTKPDLHTEENKNTDCSASKVSPKTNGAKEVGGRKGPEPTRYGDWEKNGIISDF